MGALAGDYDQFSILRAQVAKLTVKHRVKEYHTYRVWIDSDFEEVVPVRGSEENIEISGTVLRINEACVDLHVFVHVLNGFIKYLIIGGKYQFEDRFTVKEIHWTNGSEGPDMPQSIIKSVQHRDFQDAISYHPMYK